MNKLMLATHAFQRAHIQSVFRMHDGNLIKTITSLEFADYDNYYQKLRHLAMRADDLRKKIYTYPDPQIAVPASLWPATQIFQAKFILAALEAQDWKPGKTAKALGIEDSNLYRLARRLQISLKKPDLAKTA